jgi:outer membrane receptor for monomeric catechols
MDTWTLNNDWELFGGLRYDTFDYKINSGPTAYTGGTEGKVENDDSFVNGHAGVVYSLTRRASSWTHSPIAPMAAFAWIATVPSPIPNRTPISNSVPNGN